MDSKKRSSGSPGPTKSLVKQGDFNSLLKGKVFHNMRSAIMKVAKIMVNAFFLDRTQILKVHNISFLVLNDIYMSIGTHK